MTVSFGMVLERLSLDRGRSEWPWDAFRLTGMILERLSLDRGRSDWPWGAFRSTGVARNGPGARSARQGWLGMTLERVSLDRGR